MTGGKKMIISKHVTHVLDKDSEIILNDFEGKNNLSIERFIQKQVKKVLKHDLLRKAKFLDYENNIIRNCCDIIIEDKDNFLSSSKEIASYFYELMTESGDIESCDLLVASILIKDKSYVAILKLDYKKMHNHKIDFEDEKFNIQIIENEIAIQSTSVKQAAIVEINSLEIYDLYVLDVEAEKIGETGVFTKKFLNAETIEDEAYKTKQFIRLSNVWINNAIPDSLEAEKIREARNYMLKERSVMDLDEFSERALDYEQDKLFKRFCENYELENFTIDKNVVENKLKKRKIGTFSGFEISGRLEDFSDNMKFKIERNTDGSCDLIIKNVNFYEK